MLEAIMGRLVLDFSHFLIVDIHRRAFKTTTVIPFPCLIFQLYRDGIVPICHCDRLTEAIKSVDFNLIKYYANPTTPRKGPYVDLPSFCADLARDME